jgi:hypothetical protein
MAYAVLEEVLPLPPSERATKGRQLVQAILHRTDWATLKKSLSRLRREWEEDEAVLGDDLQPISTGA